MEIILKIVGIGIVTCLATMLIKPIRADFSILIAIAGGLMIIFMIINYLTDIFSTFNNIIQISGLNGGIYSFLIKIIGIGYLIEFTAGICSDTGNSSLGDKILLGGKIVIMVMALPIVMNILEIIIGILPV
ncbi:MAG: stage III sporulation protein AD [Clostridiales bacterium]|nr:stage III sporulation protein AD [Clostridiales bacterium]